MRVNSWNVCTLGDAIELKRGYDLPQQDRRNGLFPIVSSSGISGWHDEPKAQAPGVVTGRYGTLGEVFYLTEDFWPLNTTLYVKDFKGNDPRFIAYLLRSIDFFAYSDKAAVPGVNRNHLHEAKILLPPLSEQKSIASALGALDDKIAHNSRMNETLHQLARTIFGSWFISFDPVQAKSEGKRPIGVDEDVLSIFPASFEEIEGARIPKGWRIAGISEVADLISGGTPKTSQPEYWDGDILWASAKDVSQAGAPFILTTERRITKLGLTNSSTKIVPKFATAVVARGATTGRFTMFGADMAMNQTCYALKSRTGAPFFLNMLLSWEIPKLVNAAHGSVFDTITTDTFKLSKVVLPDSKLIDAYEKIVTPLLELVLSNLRETEKLQVTRDLLLPRLLSGDLKVKELQ